MIETTENNKFNVFERHLESYARCNYGYVDLTIPL